jgi:peptidoglycan/LPS O-acetylase OafA/YrhL
MALYGHMVQPIVIYTPLFYEFINHANLGVACFIVTGGFLLSSHLAPNGLWHDLHDFSLFNLIRKRYFRLVVPLLAALMLVISVAHLPSFKMPSLKVLLAHLFLLQDILGIPSLSAGVWYVGIDFQLYTLTLVIFCLTLKIQKLNYSFCCYAPLLGIVFISGLSLWIWNRDSRLDVWGIYFIGAYGLGIVAYSIRQIKEAKTRYFGRCGLVFMVLVALFIEPRSRVFVALLTALFLSIPSDLDNVPSWWKSHYLWISEASYCIFLIHYSIILLINFLLSYLNIPPSALFMNMLAFFITFLLSIGAGLLLHQFLEKLLKRNKLLNRASLLL